MGDAMSMEFDRIERIIFNSLIFINILIVGVMAAALLGIRITWFAVLIEAAVILMFYRSYVQVKEKAVTWQGVSMAAILILTAGLFSYLARYFEVVKWDGALYLIIAKGFNTQQVILTAYYKPVTWPAFLSMGLSFGSAMAIQVLCAVMLAASIYLFTLTLTGNRNAALFSLAVSSLLPVNLLWGMSYYAETYLVMLIAFGFACYFHYLDTDKKQYYVLSVMMFTMAFLTRYTFGLLFLVPAYEFFRKRTIIESVIPAGIVMFPFLLYEQLKAGSFLYPFIMYFNTANADYGHNVFSNMYYITSMNILFGWPLFILGLLGIALLLRQRRKALVLAAATLPVVIYLLFFFHLKDERYFMYMAPVLAASAGMLLAWILELRNKARFLSFIGAGAIIVIMLFNFSQTIVPMYKYTGRDILKEAALFMSGKEGNIASNSQVRLSWYVQKRVYTAVEDDKLDSFIAKNNITYLVNFEKSGSPPDFRNTSMLLQKGRLLSTFSDGYEKINVIEVGERSSQE